MAKIVECKIPKCCRKVYHCGLCCQHYRRWKKYDDPCAIPTVDTSNYLLKGSYKNNPREYRSWKNMVTRCTDSRHKAYCYYGGRGIKVCDRWLGRDGLKNFIKDMGKRPEKCTLDRIDVNGDYTPENCRWSEWCVQNYNKTMSKHSTNKTGITKTFNHGREWYIANISKNGNKQSKWFKTFEEALSWRLNKEKELYG